MGSSTFNRQVLEMIVECVPVEMMDNESPRHRPVRLLPNHHGARSPDIRFSNLDPSSRPIGAIVPIAAPWGYAGEWPVDP